jgi:TonB family protein
MFPPVLIAVLMSGVLAAQDPKQLPTPASTPGATQQAPQSSVQAQPKTGAVDILTDTQGVDFGPYLQQALFSVRKNWYRLVPAYAETQKGKLAVELAIGRDGNILGMKLVSSSGEGSLDRAAWFAIIASNPLPALPVEFKGQSLALRLRFYYNPDKGDFAGNANLAGLSSSVPTAPLSPSVTIQTAQPRADPIKHAVLIQYVAEDYTPDYPKKAREARVHGIVWLEAEVKADGRVGDVKVIEGDSTLAQASTRAIRHWRFQPAKKDNKKIEDRVVIEVEFRLDSERVGAYVMWPEQPRGVNLPQ